MPKENAKIAREILDGKEGPKMNAVLLMPAQQSILPLITSQCRMQ